MFRRFAKIVCFFVCLSLIGCDSNQDEKKKGSQAVASNQPRDAQPSAVQVESTADRQPSSDQPAIPVDGPKWTCETEHDFGEVWAGVTLRHPFEFENVGSETLKILEAKPRCSCSVAESHTKSVEPGGKGTIPFRLVTSNKSGDVDEYLDIKTNDPTQPFMKLVMKGIVKTVCDVDVIADGRFDDPGVSKQEVAKMKQTQGHFGHIKSSDELHRVLRLTNTTGSPLSLTLHSGPNAGSPFAVSFEEVQAGEVYELTVDGTPPFSEGYTSASVTFKTNIPDRPTYAVGISAYVPSRLEIVPKKIVADDRSKVNKDRWIRITNNGATPLEVTSVAVSDPNYKVKLKAPAVAQPGQEINIDVILPEGDYRPPPWGEVVRIETTDPDESLIEIYVLPHMRRPPTIRPKDLPLEFHPGEMP